ncbi:MAG: MBL fold metallo-hydrolase [Paracoccus sp. (in: a-proteobacteria)]|uniref:MBL fold metallo-hydrolase n=1 Tax=Paracoccus sp. TaxID=267 RepID=UPI0026DFC384|nr:MBL fold metallo-hydrolase [Paracoccus sp. (in: a-proteobacteria)]MDO5622579.1 MBL fold metallo-hydrolase [Paracoccus sp. (in: a-proteobacteria)]
MAIRVLAPNPSPLTGPGTNTFLIGQRHVAVIDPGPDLPTHRAAILAATPGRISHIFVTHAHLDHSEGAKALAKATGAPIIAFGHATEGRSPRMTALAAAGLSGGGEGLDAGFTPDIRLRDNEAIETPDWTIEAIHTPGHMGNHLAFRMEDQVFCGDLVMGWSSTLISPPDGDLADYFRSLDRLNALRPARLIPAHGDAIEAPLPRLAELAAHRRTRSAQILTALRQAPGTAAELATRIYDVPPALLPAATRNTFAHLIALQELGAVTAPEGGPNDQFSIS